MPPDWKGRSKMLSIQKGMFVWIENPKELALKKKTQTINYYTNK